MLTLEFRRWNDADTPPPGEIWLRPAGGTTKSTALALAVWKNGLISLDQGRGEISTLVVSCQDEQPTFDEMFAAHLVERLLIGQSLLPAHENLAKYAQQLRQGKRPTDLPVAD